MLGSAVSNVLPYGHAQPPYPCRVLLRITCIHTTVPNGHLSIKMLMTYLVQGRWPGMVVRLHITRRDACSFNTSSASLSLEQDTSVVITHLGESMMHTV